MEYLGKTSKVNDDPQEDVIISKSTRLKKLPTNKSQDFFIVNEDHKLNNLSEEIVSGTSDSSNILDKVCSLTCVNGCSGNTLLAGSINTLTTSQNLSTNIPSKLKSKIKLSHQINSSVPSTL